VFEDSDVITWGGGTIELAGGTLLVAGQGLFRIATPGSITSGSGSNAVTNLGAITTDGLKGSATIGVVLNNSSTVDATSGTLVIAGSQTNNSSVLEAQGGTLVLNGGRVVQTS